MMAIYADACKKSEHIGLGWCIEREDKTVEKGHEYIEGPYSSMEAECMALIRAMRSALRYDYFITFYTDCLPLVEHIDRSQPISDGDYIRTIEMYQDELPEHVVFWIGREHNETADREAHVAVDESRKA